jgi:microcystin-dependent protein
VADSETSNIKLTNQEEGGNNNTWGTIADNNFERIDDKFGDTTEISSTGGTTVLTDTQELVAHIDVSGTLVTNKVIQFSGRGGYWIVRNTTTGDYTLTCKLSASTGVVIPQGTSKLIWCNGDDIILGNTNEDVSPEAVIASATTTNILAAGTEFVAVSGTATITSFGTGANQKRFVRATGAFTLTHNATSLILPGGQNIKAASGDTFIVISDASSNCRVYAYMRAANPPPTIPVGASCDYWGDTAPSFYLFLYGQSVSRTTYAALFAVIGVTYGVGDGSTTFTLPDCRGRVVAGKDNMGGTSANRLTDQTGGLNGDTLGDTGGSETHTMARSAMPNVTLSGTTDNSGNHTHDVNDGGANYSAGPGGQLVPTNANTQTQAGGNHNHTVTTSSINGGVTQTAMNIVQPTIIANKIIFTGVA